MLLNCRQKCVIEIQDYKGWFRSCHIFQLFYFLVQNLVVESWSWVQAFTAILIRSKNGSYAWQTSHWLYCCNSYFSDSQIIYTLYVHHKLVHNRCGDCCQILPNSIMLEASSTVKCVLYIFQLISFSYTNSMIDSLLNIEIASEQIRSWYLRMYNFEKKYVYTSLLYINMNKFLIYHKLLPYTSLYMEKEKK